MLRRLKAAYHSFLAAGHLHNERLDEAVEHLSEAIRLSPNSPNAYLNRGYAAQGMANYGKSIDDFNKALEIDPYLAMAYFNRGVSWKMLGDFDRAIADQVRAVSLSPRLANAHLELGVAYQCSHDFDRSVASLTTAISLAPKDPSHLKYRGLALFYRGTFNAAAADLEKAFDLAPDACALAFAYLARVKVGGNARQELEGRAAKLTTGRWPAAVVELYLGRLTVDAVLAAAATSDEFAEAQFYVGEWHLVRNDTTSARLALEMARRSCPPVFIEHTAATVELKRLESSVPGRAQD